MCCSRAQLAEAIFRLFQQVHAPYFALFLVGPAALLIEMWWKSRKAPAKVESK